MRSCLIGFCLVLVAAVAEAQDTLPPWEGGYTHSLGQPHRLRLHAGGSIGGNWRGGELTPLGFVSGGAFRSLGNPVIGLAGVALEGFAGFRGEHPDAGLRGLLVSQTLRVSVGLELTIRDGRISPLLGYTMPVRRGGVFGGGSVLRLDWLPGSGSTLRLGVLAPIGVPWAGHTRSHADKVTLPLRSPWRRVPEPPSPALADALANVAIAAHRLADVVVPFIDAQGPSPGQALAPVAARLRAAPALPGYVVDGTVGTEQVVRIFHRELTRAFSIAASGRELELGQSTPDGEALTRRARAVLLEHVLYPFNRLLGQRKNDEALRALGRYALGSWARELVALRELGPDREAAVLEVFERLVGMLEEVRLVQVERWHDSRLGWLPLQYGLLPEDHDTQAELDQIVEAAVGQSFTDGNEVWYVVNGQFPEEVSRSIAAARDYHVLWIHDFRGRNARGEPDAQSLRFVADAYLGALTKAVSGYDQRHRMPIFLIFLDQHYYEANRARLWMDFLERPLGRLPTLPAGFASFDSALTAAQAALRDAIASSRLLQAEARQYGSRWLENQVKVHVNITNPADPSFWGRDIMPILGFPDNLMRDHRKIAFYDVTEEDPYRGLAIYTGMGIGEHYAGSTWEDRAIMARGPVLATLKDRAREVLLTHGMSEEQIPYPLRPRSRPLDYDERVRRFIGEQGGGQRAMELHNLTGYEDKPINVAKATLYTLMPPGSVIKTPDSIWGSAFYASLLTGSALRGARVLMVAPALVSAPSSGWPSMGLAHDLFARLIVMQQELGAELDAAGGVLKTGIYNPGIGVDDVLGRFGAAYQNARRTPFLRRLYPVDPSIDSMLVRFRELRLARDLGATTLGAGSSKLHLKANWFSSREAWDGLIGRPEMSEVLQAYLGQLIDSERESRGAREVAEALNDASRRLFEGVRRSQTPDELARVVYYLMIGSANQDYRSMFMDGEASVLLSGWSTVVGLMDFALIASLSVWVDDLEMLDALLPRPSPFQLMLARRLRAAL